MIADGIRLHAVLVRVARRRAGPDPFSLVIDVVIIGGEIMYASDGAPRWD